MAVSRQLASIMFADIAGYTAMIQQDEANALRLRQKFVDTLVDITGKHNGRVVEVIGDGALCIFQSAVESINAATLFQQNMLQDPVVPVRIGLHTGDVILEGQHVYGNSVNLASRIESFAVPGSVLVSEKIIEEIKNHRGIESVRLGRFDLKNVSEPVELFAIRHDTLTIPDVKTLAGKGKRVQRPANISRSVLVLPFVNLSNDPNQEYFSDGLTEELITSLSRLKDLRVTSRTTSMRYKGSTQELKTMANENDAAYVLEGSVRQHGNNLRITAQLIEARRDVHLWGDSFRGTIDDIFDIQETVSEKIAAALQIQLTKEEQQLLERRYTDDTEAYQLYLKGRHNWRKRDEEGLTKAVEYFQQALEKDSGYALALAGLADSYSLMGEYTNISRRELYPKQMAAVNKALAIDNRLGEVHISRAISLMLNEWDWKNSEASFKLGLALNPKYATGHHWYGEWLLFMGETSSAFEEIREAIDLEPLSLGILKDKGIFHYYNREFGAAIDQGLMTLQLQPNFVPVYRLLSLGYQGLGQFNEAIRYNEQWGKRTGNEAKTQVALADIYAAAGRTRESLDLIQKIEENLILSANDNRGIAQAYAALGNTDKALEFLDRSYHLHEESLCSIKIDHKMDPLRNDERFKSLMKKVNFED